MNTLIHTYEEAIEWIHSRLRFGIKPGLNRMKWMMEKLDHPERKIKAVHVAGTNGKGSTVTFLRTILQTAGCKTGTFTSPYFEQFNERISVNGAPIDNQALIDLVNMIKPLADELEETDDGAPTEFEVITTMAFVYFAKINPVDIVLFEVGLGGRLDSTNVLHPVLTVITSIGLDHTNILGSTIEEIAHEKAGIVKSGVPLITGVHEQAALEVITKKAHSAQVTMYQLGEQMTVEQHESLNNGEQFSIRTPFRSYKKLQTSLIGKHQTENAALAVMAADYLSQYLAFDISKEAIRIGLKTAYWPGRFEVLSTNPLVIIDGAHNEAGVNSLVASVKQRYADKNIHLLFTALHDKELAEMIHKLDKLADEITFVAFDFPRAAKAEQLYALSSSQHKQCIPNWRQAISDKLPQLTEQDVFIITGSLYFIAEVKPFLNTQL